ncbi:MAG TPA: alpha/beta fold hydrolase [Planctomycetes bacterium]|nr:alpha/beta fold hydrolase [Planctomycetota bacterium]HIK59227.1 alpha/beta fold hydrolase [Planctomycetota bacterium]
MHRLSILISALLAACGLVPQATYETIQKDAAYRTDVTTGAFVELDGGHCYYELGGPASEESEQALLVLVHGFSVPSYIWDPTFQEAVRRGRPVLRLDLFGRGHSSNPDANYDPDLCADQIIGLLDHLEYRRPVHLVGLSMGGVVVARTAARHPARIQTLVMVDPSGFQPGYGQDLDTTPLGTEEIAAFIKADFPTRAESQLADFLDPGPFAHWPELYRPLLQHRGFARALLSTIRCSPPMDGDHRLIQQASFPVHLLWGRQDAVIPLAESLPNVRERLPRGEVHVIEECGHLPHMEQREAFETLFFDGILGRG